MIAFKKFLILSLVASAAIWAVFSWPLPACFTSSVPASSSATDENPVRTMIPGDHLQLIYNYWVFADMALGGTPWFYNLYEFNTGDDEARRYVGADLFPFSIVYIIGQFIGDRAVAFNLVGFVTIWFTFLFTWLLIHRYIDNLGTSALAAALAIALPYRWHALLGGSPTGFAMVCVPWLMLGLDIAVRERSLRGGLLAATAMLTAYLNDAHIFFFGFLFSPAWLLFSFFFHQPFRLLEFKKWPGLVWGLSPYALLMAYLIFSAQSDKAEEVPGTTIESGRDWHELGIYSPHPDGLIRWLGTGHEQSIYISVLIPVLVLLAVVALLCGQRREKSRGRDWFALIGLITGLSGIIVLALGTQGPFEGLGVRAARKLLPHYDMIRQPAKIYALVPPMLALLAGYSLCLLRTRVSSRFLYSAGLGLTLLVLLDYNHQIKPSICRLEFKQGSYEAIVRDAANRGVICRAVAVPLWPGNDAWSSLYQHYGSLYRIRMANGYLPVVPQDYIEHFAKRYEWINAGLLENEKLDELAARGIDYILLHENAFPDKVSAYSVGYTLHHLLTNPRLAFIHQSESVWAFRINPPDQPTPGRDMNWPLFAPTRHAHHQMEGMIKQQAEVLEDPTASHGRFARMEQRDAHITGWTFPHGGYPASRLLLRVRGTGALSTSMQFEEGVTITNITAVEHAGWSWLEIPYAPPSGSRTITVTWAANSGRIDMDMVIYAAGSMPLLKPGASFTIPAPVLFHGGYTGEEGAYVQLRPEHEPDGDGQGVVNGPNLPVLEPGTYRIEIDYESDAEIGTILGSAFAASEFGRTETATLVQGNPLMLTLDETLTAGPFSTFIDYSRLAGLKIKSLTLTRIR